MTPHYTNIDLRCSHLTIGCSHTRAIYLPRNSRWPHIVQKKIGVYFEYEYTSKIASGLVHLEKRCRSIQRDQIKYVVIQKPQAIRFPWWLSNWETVVSQSSYGSADLVKGRKYALREFSRMSHKKQKRTVQHIYDEELKCLSRIRQLFPAAKMAYYHYWADNILDQLHRPNIAHVNEELGNNLADLGIDNWGMIIDPRNIPGVYDKDGNILMNLKTIFQSGWGAAQTDPHPGSKFHELVASKVLEWLPN